MYLQRKKRQVPQVERVAVRQLVARRLAAQAQVARPQLQVRFLLRLLSQVWLWLLPLVQLQPQRRRLTTKLGGIAEMMPVEI
ncbi:MAG: hypothetical protein KGL01_06385 [Betaproteobacteria bacterium]|nr:hypothetical protein [Betaproteobacteria bacterium]